MSVLSRPSTLSAPWWRITSPLSFSRLRKRFREPAFWIVQMGVLAVMTIHGAVEGLHVIDGGVGSVLLDVSVVLYLVPVVYAGLRYGLEGGALTATWASLLAAPNLILFHRDGYEWVGEMIVLGFVVGLGVVIAMPVERERRQRARAEAASLRLGLLNDVASLMMRPTDLGTRLDAVTRRLVDVVGLRSAAIVTCDGQSSIRVQARWGDEAWWPERVLTCLPGGGPPPPDRVGDTWLHPVEDDSGSWGCLLAREQAEAPLRPADRAVLAAVAAQLGVALENHRLHRLERERLQSFVTGVTRAQEQERSRIARDLHDVATHELLLVCREADAMLEGETVGLPDGLQTLRDRTASVVDYLRRFTRDLRPSVLDHLGVVPALSWMASEVAERTGLQVEVQTSGEPCRLAAEAEIAVYRIVEEALRNVDRHADASRVDVAAAFADGRLEVTVTDDGRGFAVVPTPELIRRGKLGLLGMQERAQLLGGVLAIEPGRTGGTRVHASIPTGS